MSSKPYCFDWFQKNHYGNSLEAYSEAGLAGSSKILGRDSCSRLIECGPPMFDRQTVAAVGRSRLLFAAVTTVWLTMLVLGLEVRDQQTRLAVAELSAKSAGLSSVRQPTSADLINRAASASLEGSISKVAVIQQDLSVTLLDSIQSSSGRYRVVISAFDRRNDGTSSASVGSAMPATATTEVIQITLRGSYAGIKAALADAIDRTNGAEVESKVEIRRLDIRRATDNADVEAVAQVAIFRKIPSPGAEEPAPPTAQVQHVLSAARFDPFNGLPANPPPQPAPAQPAASPPAGSLAPVAPVLNYRFFGRMTTPQGQVMTLLAREDHVVVVEPGQQLDEGYVVESVDLNAVRLHYPPLDVHVSIVVPPPTVEPMAAKPGAQP